VPISVWFWWDGRYKGESVVQPGESVSSAEDAATATATTTAAATATATATTQRSALHRTTASATRLLGKRVAWKPRSSLRHVAACATQQLVLRAYRVKQLTALPASAFVRVLLCVCVCFCACVCVCACLPADQVQHEPRRQVAGYRNGRGKDGTRMDDRWTRRPILRTPPTTTTHIHTHARARARTRTCYYKRTR
jgi:hypothetical protein